jgi:hypothetical protein
VVLPLLLALLVSVWIFGGFSDQQTKTVIVAVQKVGIIVYSELLNY